MAKRRFIGTAERLGAHLFARLLTERFKKGERSLIAMIPGKNGSQLIFRLIVRRIQLQNLFAKAEGLGAAGRLSDADCMSMRLRFMLAPARFGLCLIAAEKA